MNEQHLKDVKFLVDTLTMAMRQLGPKVYISGTLDGDTEMAAELKDIMERVEESETESETE